MSYEAFIASKAIVTEPAGFEVDSAALHPALFDFQRDLTVWALRRGRAALFADCGLGKTLMQLEWARRVAAHTNGRVLVLAPLAVSAQTSREARKLGMWVAVSRDGRLDTSVTVTNYERLHHFDPTDFTGVVLDESSILKDYSGKTRQQIQAFAEQVDYRLACTATPAPNDLLEITNHSEYCGAMRGKEIMALFFLAQEDASGRHYRLKRHATQDFYAWLASWAAAIRSPADLGHDAAGFVLPELRIEQVVVEGADLLGEGRLFEVQARTLSERQRARRESVTARVAAFAKLVRREPREQWIAWCGLNAESEALTRAVDGAVEVRGSDSADHKERALEAFANGDIRVLVTKPSIAGHGMNFQGCARMGFVGLSDSFEQYYQALRRCWRFGRKREVHAYVITAAAEGAVVANIERKERQAAEMMDGMVNAMGRLTFGRDRELREPYEPQVAAMAPAWLQSIKPTSLAKAA